MIKSPFQILVQVVFKSRQIMLTNEMQAKTVGDVQEESEQEDMAWNNDWDDNDSTGALESQQMLNPTRHGVFQGEDDEIGLRYI